MTHLDESTFSDKTAFQRQSRDTDANVHAQDADDEPPVADYDELEQENQQLREEIEQFNRELTERDQEIEQLHNQMTELIALLQQVRQEQKRLPSLHARSAVQQQIFHPHAHVPESLKSEQNRFIASQELLALNVWLVTQNRFFEEVAGYYIRKRDRMVIIRNYESIKYLIAVGMLPDIIITGTYDFGIDDPECAALFEFLNHSDNHLPKNGEPHEFFLVTMSSSIPAHASSVKAGKLYMAHHEYISKFSGLQITISELRFFLEMRRSRQDILHPEMTQALHSMADVPPVMQTLQRQQQTGMLLILSENTPIHVRWALQVFFLKGKAVKTEHTLESDIHIADERSHRSFEQHFTIAALNPKYKLNPPRQLYFFPLYQHTILRELGDQKQLSDPPHKKADTDHPA